MNMALLLRAWQTSCETKCNIYTLAEFGAQGRAWTSHFVPTINEEVGGVYDVNVLYRGYVQLTNTKN